MVRRFALPLMALAAIATPRIARADPEFVMKLATVAPEGTPWSEALEKFKAQVLLASKGRLKVKVFYGATLGDENETVLSTKRGQIQAVGASTGALASVVTELNMVELPFLFKTEAEADVVLDTILQKPMEKFFRAKGLVLGFWSENGYRSFGTKDGFVTSPAKLKGKKMRAQESPVHTAMYKAYGASAQPIPTTEVFQATKTGVVDGWDQTALYAAAASWHKTVKFYTVSNHIYQPAAIVFNAEWYDKLPADIQTILVDARKDFQNQSRKAVRKLNKAIVKNLEGDGVKVYTLTAAERATFLPGAQKVRAAWKAKQSKEVQALLGEVEKKLGLK